MNEDSSNRKKKRKRGRSLIFKTCFLLPGCIDDDHEEKVLASDDNLVYCDLTNTGSNRVPSVKKRSSSSRGRMSSIFKAVLFDTAMKKKMRGRKTSKTTIEPMNSSLVADETNSSLVPDEKKEKLFDKNVSNVVKVLEAGNDSTSDSPNLVSLPLETDASPVASSSVNTDSQMLTEEKVKSPVVSSSVSTGSQILTERKVTSPIVSSSVNTSSHMLTERKVTSPVASSSDNIGSQMLTERKVMSRVNSSKKPPLPSVSRSRPVKHISEMDSNVTTLNSTSRLCLLIVVAVFMSVVLWMSFTTIVTESADLDSDPYTNIAIVGDEL